MYKYCKAVFLICYLAVLGCSKQSGLDDFYKKIANDLKGSEYLNKIRSSSSDSLYQLTGAYNRSYEGKLLIDSTDNNIWFEVNKDRFIGLDGLIKDDILIRSFKQYLDNKAIDLDRIKTDAAAAAYKRELEWNEKEARWEKELKLLMELNDRNCHVGDTIKLYFQLKGNKNYYDVSYKQYPSSAKFYLGDDTLKILGILKSKIYDKERSGNINLDSNDIMNLWFKVEIVDISNRVSHDGPQLLESGNDFKFELAFYGLRIK